MLATSKKKDEVLLWLITTAFCLALYKSIEGEDWEEMYFVQRNEQVCGAEAHTGALWKMKANQGRRRNVLRPHA